MHFNNSISKYDWQYLVTGSFLISVFIFTDLIRVLDKEYFYFVPKLISDQPYRIFTSILKDILFLTFFELQNWILKKFFCLKNNFFHTKKLTVRIQIEHKLFH